MIRNCNGADPGLVGLGGGPCACGARLDDAQRSTWWPHPPLPARSGAPAGEADLQQLHEAFERQYGPPVTAAASSVDPSAAAGRVAATLAQVRETLAPIEEAARGQRAHLEAAGWSPAVAEQMAVSFYVLVLTRALTPGRAGGVR